MKYLILGLSMLIQSPGVMDEPASADGVAAIVNEDVITHQELSNHFQLLLRQLSENPSARQQEMLYQNTLLKLIEGKLKAQYAQERGITVPEQEITLAIAEVSRNARNAGRDFATLSRGLENTVRAEIKTDLIWQKLIVENIRPGVTISNAELDRMIGNLLNQKTVVEQDLQQIFISDNNQQARQNIQKIYETLQQNPDDFTNIATSYDPVNNGNLGWLSPAELTGNLSSAVSGLTAGDISIPVKSTTGWHILKVLRERTKEPINVQEVITYQLYPLIYSGNDVQTWQDETDDLETLAALRSYVSLNSISDAHAGSGEVSWYTEEQLPAQVNVADFNVNTLSPVYQTTTGYVRYYPLAIRTEIPKERREYRERLRERLGAARTEVAAREFLRNLKRNAYIDIRR